LAPKRSRGFQLKPEHKSARLGRPFSGPISSVPRLMAQNQAIDFRDQFSLRGVVFHIRPRLAIGIPSGQHSRARNRIFLVKRDELIAPLPYKKTYTLKFVNKGVGLNLRK
jgi:hypothetical protein